MEWLLLQDRSVGAAGIGDGVRQPLPVAALNGARLTPLVSSLEECVGVGVGVCVCDEARLTSLVSSFQECT
jgi:hypothetical protein